MNVTIDMIRRAVTLDEAFFREFLASKNVMKRGFLIFLACFIIATIPVFGQQLINNWRGFTPEMAADFQEQFLTMFEQFQPAEGAEGMDVEQFRNNFQAGINMGVEISELPTPLPRAVASFFVALGAWATAALAPIGTWIGYGAVVLLFAKLAGGRGVLNPFFGLTALVAIPNLIRILNFIPFIGPLFTLVGLVRGIVVYVRAVQISQEFTAGKAFLVSFLPALILLALGICFGSIWIFSLINAIGSAQ